MNMKRIAERVAALTLIEWQITLHEWVSESGKCSLSKQGLPLESVNEVYENLRQFYSDSDESICTLIDKMFDEIPPDQSALMTSKALFLLRSGFGFKSAVLMLNSFFDRPEALAGLYWEAIQDVQALVDPDNKQLAILIDNGAGPSEFAKSLRELADAIPVRISQGEPIRLA